MLMNGQYGAMSPWSGMVGGVNSLSGMMDNYNRMKVNQLFAQNYPNVIQQHNLSANLANQSAQTTLNYLAPYLSARNDIESTTSNYLPSYLAARNLGENLSNQSQTIDQQILRQKLLQAQNPLANLQSPMGQALSDQAQIHRIYGDGSPQALAADAYVQKLNATRAASTGAPQMVQLPNGAIVPATSQNTASTATPLTTTMPVQTNVAPNAATVAQQAATVAPTYAGGVPTAATQGSVVPLIPDMTQNAPIQQMPVPQTVAQQQQNVAPQVSTPQQGQPLVYSSVGLKPGSVGGGNVLLNPVTGEQISTPTRGTITNVQSQLRNEQAASNMVQGLYGAIAPELGGIGGMIRRGIGAAEQAKNISNPVYEKYLAARQNIPLTVDSLLGATQLPKTDKAIAGLTAALTPASMGTKSAYLQNIASTLADLALKDETNRAILAQGFDLSGNKQLPSHAALQQKYYDMLSPKVPSVASSQTTYGKNKWPMTSVHAYAVKNGLTDAQVEAIIDQADGRQVPQGGQ